MSLYLQVFIVFRGFSISLKVTIIDNETQGTLPGASPLEPVDSPHDQLYISISMSTLIIFGKVVGFDRGGTKAGREGGRELHTQI